MEFGRVNAKTDVKLKPERSQVFVVALAVISGISLVAGCLFLWHKPVYSWVPFLFSVLFGGTSIFAWTKSHKNIDLAGAAPTTISKSGANIQVSTDSRALTSPETIQALEKIFALLGHREPLPEPDGLIGADGKPTTGSKLEAEARVRQANDEASRLAKDAAILFGGERAESIVEQPQMNAPGNGVLIKTNAPDDGSA